MTGRAATRLRAAIAAAATLTGKRFGLLVASSVVATSAIVAAAATNQPEASPLAAMLGHSLAAERTPVATPNPTPLEPAAEPEHEEAPARPVAHESRPVPEPVVPTPTPEPVVLPEETATEAPPEPEPEAEAAPEEPEAPPPAPRPEAGRIKHVFLISLVSSGYQVAFGAGAASQMPYLNGTLRPRGLLLTNYSVLSEAVTPNGIAAISGQPPNKGTETECPVFEEECLYPVETSTIAGQLEIAGFTWRAYLEGMVSTSTGAPENCVYPAGEEEEKVEVGGYSARLNPFTHFHSLLDVGTCAAADVPITELKRDLKSEAKTPSFSYISPASARRASPASAGKEDPKARRRPTPGSRRWCRRSLHRPPIGRTAC